ncbi:MAG: hypothetical protein IPM35_37230 [Myxococcales bacterium]|nr:hypothetical protein [Myxococcales bacterium]
MLQRLTAIGLLGAVLGAACGSSSSDDPGSGGSGGTGGSAQSFGASDCGQCVASSCAVERSACGAEPACASVLGCVEACPAEAGGGPIASCETGCSSPADGPAKAAFDAYSTCRAAAPCAACGAVQDGGGGASGASKVLDQECGPSTKTHKCLKCLDEQCCKTEAACEQSPECKAAYQCWKDCPDNACLEACFAQHPDGVQLFLEQNACPLALCATPESCLADPGPELICDNQYCRELRVACFVILDCYLMFDCRAECAALPLAEQPACLTKCEEGRSQEALDAYDAWGLCSEAKCP